MKCPHCNTGVSIEFEEYHGSEDPEHPGKGYEIACGDCPECDKFIVLLRYGTAKTQGKEYHYLTITNAEREEVLFPKNSVRFVEPEVPDEYRNEFLEACAVLSVSPKASAALSRRLLQQVMREKYRIKHRSLAQEIEEFIKRKDIPSFLSEAVDAIRNVGNFAAHPLKDTNTGEIVDVEPGEAEWLLEVLESLFDITFVQPARLKARKDKLNLKLQSLGKPPMKS